MPSPRYINIHKKLTQKVNPESLIIANKKRTIPEDQKYISCFAPFNHLRINRLGEVSPCCFSTHRERWKRGSVSLHEIWFEGIFTKYQEQMINEKLHSGCTICINKINRNITSHIPDYDWNDNDRMRSALNITYPKILDIELSNLCNLECPMCFGFLSSKHAMNRDKFYNEKAGKAVQGMKKEWGANRFDSDKNLYAFIEELKEFIPHCKEMRFSGGEPFAHKAMYKIAKVVAEINPEIKLEICTNGTVYNKNVEKIIKENNVYFSFSIDTVIPKEYNSIRVGAEYEKTFRNIEKISQLTKPENITISTVLMSKNCENFIKFFKWGYDRKYKIFVNTYDLHGRKRWIPDWSLYLVDKEIKDNVIKQCEYWLNKIKINEEDYKSEDLLESRNLAKKLAVVRVYNDNYENQLKKVIFLLKENNSKESIDVTEDDVIHFKEEGNRTKT